MRHVVALFSLLAARHETGDGEVLFLGSEPLGRGGVVGQDEKGADGKDDGGNAFNDEQPGR